MTGYLELFIGPMFSGKTSTLLNLYKKYKFCNLPCVIINHSCDTRYHETLVSTHDKIMAPCIQTDSLSTLWKSGSLKDYKVLLINEGQFFDDLVDTVKEMVLDGKRIYICGLDGDFERKKFGHMLDLIPYCDNVTKLTSLCSRCKDGTAGIFSMRLTADRQQTLVGSDSYQPVCRACYDR